MSKRGQPNYTIRIRTAIGQNIVNIRQVIIQMHHKVVNYLNRNSQ